ncbi:hypothetical protein H257_13312 [Aphanomyces astaci]|uniref:DDE Tnp4 domain-containing protein n=1 Tax=Aphanomyces astaci TaxID=112090 RepID=W4FX98_APHAT|nr:hypothetical protein H257_13312 [Aphanomyces astaci]ETV71429.1 hypothetical protein H257_13312 [Aphanomyces astaci]|eukprot:XP_009839094.1 hypothetical protein H257_13312 [Aphanomyces astaci]
MSGISEEDYGDITNYIRTERPRSLTKEERLDILRLHAQLRRDNARQVSATIAHLLGRSERIVQEVWSTYMRTKAVVAVLPPSNTQQRPTRITRTHAISSMVRQYIRQRSLTRARTVAKDVMALLVEAGVIQCNTQDRGSSASCLRIVQIYLEKLGFKRGKRRGKATYSVSSGYAAARDIYVQKMNNLDANAPVVYMDENYIHDHYTRHQDSLFDPTDDAPLKEKHKGRRMCFIAGIMAGRASGANSKDIALDIFEGGKKSKDDPKDYHAIQRRFNSQMSKVRKAVEWSFGRLKILWLFVFDSKKM